MTLETTLRKLAACGLLKEWPDGRYSFGPPDLRDTKVQIRRLTEQYGRLEGDEAKILAVIPPTLFFAGRAMSISELSQVVGVL